MNATDNEVHTRSEPRLADLVSGIVSDVQQLLKQQLLMFRQEFEEDARKTREATTIMAAGATVALAGMIVFCIGLAYLLNWAAPSLPLWACFAIIGGAGTGLGGILVYQSWWEFRSFNPFPDKSVRALQENLEWKTAPK